MNSIIKSKRKFFINQNLLFIEVIRKIVKERHLSDFKIIIFIEDPMKYFYTIEENIKRTIYLSFFSC